MPEYIEREALIAETNRLLGGSFSAGLICEAIEKAPAENVINADEVIKFINFSINGTTEKTDYDIGLRNGLRLALSVIDGKEPDFEKCDSSLLCGALLPITSNELRYLINDMLSYVWKLEKKGLDKACFGYFDRKELIEKLKKFRTENFPPITDCAATMDNTTDNATMDGVSNG